MFNCINSSSSIIKNFNFECEAAMEKKKKKEEEDE